MTPHDHLEDVLRIELRRVVGLLEHAGTHIERKNVGAVAEAVMDATRRAKALLALLDELGDGW